jgi:hypothetical protein
MYIRTLTQDNEQSKATERQGDREAGLRQETGREEEEQRGTETVKVTDRETERQRDREKERQGNHLLHHLVYSHTALSFEFFPSTEQGLAHSRLNVVGDEGRR